MKGEEEYQGLGRDGVEKGNEAGKPTVVGGASALTTMQMVTANFGPGLREEEAYWYRRIFEQEVGSQTRAEYLSTRQDVRGTPPFHLSSTACTVPSARFSGVLRTFITGRSHTGDTKFDEELLKIT